jgi:hypothetical protein
VSADSLQAREIGIGLPGLLLVVLVGIVVVDFGLVAGWGMELDGKGEFLFGGQDDAHAPEEGVVMEQMVQEVRFAEAGVLQCGKSCLGPLSELFLREDHDVAQCIVHLLFWGLAKLSA